VIFKGLVPVATLDSSIFPEIIPGKELFPDSSNNVTDLVTELVPASTVAFEVYCNRYLL